MTRESSHSNVESSDRSLAAIMFTDVVGFSRKMGKDEARTVRLVRRDLEHIEAVCAASGGKTVKRMGDGCMLIFSSGVRAVECAVTIQKDFAEQRRDASEGEVLMHRIGIHLGDVFMDSGEVLGDGVNIASRIESEAPPGGICISRALYEVVRTRMELKITSLGTKRLKNIQEPIRVYQVFPGESTRRFPPWLGRIVRRAGIAVLVLAVLCMGTMAVRRIAGGGEKGSPGRNTGRLDRSGRTAGRRPGRIGAAGGEAGQGPGLGFELLDKNSDNVIEKNELEEISESARRRILRADLDQNGSITRREMDLVRKTSVVTGRKEGGRRPASADGARDRRLLPRRQDSARGTKEEDGGKLMKLFLRTDTNGDGRITPDEATASTARDMVRRLDGNRDGVLTREEFEQARRTVRDVIFNGPGGLKKRNPR